MQIGWQSLTIFGINNILYLQIPTVQDNFSRIGINFFNIQSDCPNQHLFVKIKIPFQMQMGNFCNLYNIFVESCTN